MKIIGLTGGIATGKSTVARMFVELGAAHIDADAISRNVVEPEKPAYRAIVDEFGQQVLSDDGSIDRPKLRKLVFSDPEKRNKLNGIVHPAVLTETNDMINRLRRDGALMIIYEAALLVEIGMVDFFDSLVVVDCPADIQISRLQARDNSSIEDAKQALASQLPSKAKRDVADFVVENGDDLKNTENQVRRIWERLSSKE